VLVKLFYTYMCFLCNSRFKSSLELMLCVIDISTLNKTYLIFDLYSDVQHFVLSYVFTFRVPCCDVRCNFRIDMMFGSSLPQVIWRRTNVLFTLFFFFCIHSHHSGVQYILTSWVTWLVSHKRQELLAFHCTWVNSWFLVGSVLFMFLVFSVVFFVLFVFVLCLVYPILAVSLDCPFLFDPSVFSNIHSY